MRAMHIWVVTQLRRRSIEGGVEMTRKDPRYFTLDDVGGYGDANISGHAYLRESIAALCEQIMLPELAVRLLASASDDTTVEDEAIEALNEQCANTVHFALVDGELRLFETELDPADRAWLDSD